MRKFCENCLKDVDCRYYEKERKIHFNDKDVIYLEKYYVCNECYHKFYDDLHDYNVHTVNNEIRKLNDLITIEEIEELINKYNIDPKVLSIILGLDQDTIPRYLEEENPSRENSNLLKCVSNNPIVLEMFLSANVEKLFYDNLDFSIL